MRPLAGLALLLASSALAPRAVAQEDDVERARAEFGEGVTHAQAERWAEAEAAFRRALALHDAPSIRYNLAAALVERGALREAHGQLLAVEAEADLDPALAPRVVELRERMREVGARVSVRRAEDIADAEVVIDREPVDDSWLGGDIPLAAGAHRFEATRAGEVLGGVEVTLAAGERSVVALGVGERVVTREAPAVEPGEGGGDDGVVIGLAVGGGVVAVAAVIVIVAVVAGGGQGVVEGDFGPPVLTFP